MRAETPALQTPALQTPALQQPVDPDLMQQLQAELDRVLAANPPRSTSTPPSGERAAAPLTYNGGNSSLVWGYYSPGDYDQNGIVNVSDLTPLGQNFGKTAFGGSFPVNSTEAVVDGDGNGEINLADVTPIGVNFGVQCSGYNIYVAENETAVPPSPDAPNGSGASLVDSVAFNAANLTGGRKDFTLQVVPTAQQQQFWVRSTDGKLDGAASNAVAVNLPPAQPPQAAITPTGDTGTMAHIIWDATASFDPDGEIVKYEWDFDGDGLFDYTTDGNDATADFYYYEAGQFSATVQVTDDTQRTDTATAVVNISQVQSWQETVADERLDEVGVPIEGIRTPVRLMEVDGRPAMIYVRKQEQGQLNSQRDAMAYLIADDSTGETWPEPMFIDRGEPGRSVEFFGAASLVEGLSALSYKLTAGDSNDYEQYIFFAKAGNRSGGIWNTSEVYYSDRRGDAEGPLLYPPYSLQTINGIPAILGNLLSLNISNEARLDFVHALNVSGSLWKEPVESAIPIQFGPSWSVNSVNGKLARIERANDEDMLFNLQKSSENLVWSEPELLIDKLEKVGNNMQILDIAGKPGVVYFETNDSVLKFRLAADEEGTSWKEPVVLDPEAGSVRMAVIVDQRPLIIYTNRISDEIVMLAANDPAGTYWGLPAKAGNLDNLSYSALFSNSVGTYRASGAYNLAEVNGFPAFSYIIDTDIEQGATNRSLMYISYQ